MIWGALLLLAFIWGSSFILMKIALFDKSGNPVYSALEVAALRIAIAGIVLLPVTIRHLKKVDRSKWLSILAIGVFGNMLDLIFHLRTGTAHFLGNLCQLLIVKFYEIGGFH